MSTADLIQESSKMFGQQTGQRLALMFLANEAQRQRDVAIKNSVDPSAFIKESSTRTTARISITSARQLPASRRLSAIRVSRWQLAACTCWRTLFTS